VLSVVGTAAMIWVGGGIVIHGLGSFGLPQLDHWIEGLAHGAGALLPQLSGLASELTIILADGIFGLALGLLLIPVVGKLAMPAWRAARGLFGH